MLAKATAHQEQHADRHRRPVFHFSVPVGWLNDPNGLSVFNGQVHLFYQYYPYGPYWSYMHWGHAASRDLTFWEDLPVAMAPDTEYDSAGCFSGSAIVKDGRHMLLYTGVAGAIGEDGLPHGPQQQCLAEGDGIRYAKSGKNPVIPSTQLPPGYLPQDFRDPKVWEEDGIYRMAAAAAKPDGLGTVLIYESPDLENWTLRGVLLENNGEWGTMWECPDIFTLDGTDVALISVIGMPPGREDFHSQNPVLAVLGEIDWDNLHFAEQAVQQLDEGRDFYAPQTFLMPDGRRILIGWMQEGHNRIAPPGQNWQGMMTYPRELSLSDGRVRQQPAREVESFWTGETALEDFEVRGETEAPGISGRALDLTLTLKELTGSYFRIALAKGPSGEVTLTWEPETRTMTFDRSRAGGGSEGDLHPVQSFRVRGEDPLSLRLLLDRNSLEVFADEGRQTFTGIFYAPDEASGITFSTDGLAHAALLGRTIEAKPAAAI